MTDHYPKEHLLQLYRQMLRIRLFENELERHVQTGYIHGTTHLYNGQEAIAVGICDQLRKEDYITSSHRGHGHALAKGASMKRMMAEMFGKVTGYSKGKGGSMHLANIADGNLGSNGVVGGGIPIAVGAALTSQMQGKDLVAVSFFGDGATNEGSFHESLNIASIWKLPVIFVCENNRYGMSSPISEMTNITNLSERAKAYGIPGVTIDGNDIFQVIEAAKTAINRARKHEGPSFIEANTYRFKGHSRSDQEVYRSPEEVSYYMQQDPITRFEDFLNTTIAIKELDEIRTELQQEVLEATNFAKQSPPPPLSELLTDIYAKS